MTLNSFIDIFSMAGLVLQGVLAVALVGKKAWKPYPLFTVYSLLNFGFTVALYVLHTPPAIYFYSFWIGEAITIVLGFGVIYELFQNLFSNHRAVLKQARLVLRWTCVALLCVAVSVILVQAPIASMLRSGVLIFEEALRVVELGLLMFLFAASLALGLHWRQAEFGIALGLGLFVAVELAAVALRSQIGPQTSLWQLLDVIRILAFDTSLVVWLRYLLAPEKAANGRGSVRFGVS
jgi:putative Mn2+ efflux pump MntP